MAASSLKTSPLSGLRGPADAADTAQPETYLPDFCSGMMALAVVLASELLAILLAVARHPAVQDFWIDLARHSLFLLWVGLGSAWLLCQARRRLGGADAATITLVSLVLLLLATALVSEAAWWLGRHYADRLGSAVSMFPAEHWPFLARNLTITTIVGALALRYFYVAHQWKRNVEMEARSRIRALQARIRPHFLFNSMNTIASLTRTEPQAAEQVVEDLADLFRASLSDSKTLVPLGEELEMAAVYQRIEERRLGERLSVEWTLDDLPMRALIPGLTVQPLLENAIYHGIEPLPDGGTVQVRGGRDGNDIWLEIANPVASDETAARRRAGNRVALLNVRQRLELAYAGAASLRTDREPGRFRVMLRFPCMESPASGVVS